MNSLENLWLWKVLDAKAAFLHQLYFSLSQL